jgi:hypothetical protein
MRNRRAFALVPKARDTVGTNWWLEYRLVLEFAVDALMNIYSFHASLK